MRGLFLAVVISALASAQAFADVRIYSSPGGNVETYLTFFSRVRQSGERVIIDGPCYFGLHTRAEHDSAQSGLCHTARRSRLSCARGGRRQRAALSLAPGDPSDVRVLSPNCEVLDQAPRRAQDEPHLFTGPGAGGPVPAVLAQEPPGTRRCVDKGRASTYVSAAVFRPFSSHFYKD